MCGCSGSVAVTYGNESAYQRFSYGLSANIDFARQGMLLGSPEATFLSRMIGRRGTHWLADTPPDSRFMLFQGSPVNAGSFYEPSGSRRGTILLLGLLPVRWLLSLLQLLRLLLVFLLQLLCLLLVLLLHLLLLRVIRLLFIQLHVLLVLLLLEFVSFLLLLREYFSCCCWYFLSSFGLPVFGVLPCQWRKVVRMNCRTGSCGVVL